MKKNQTPPIKIVLNETCNLNCSFCHHEGKTLDSNGDIDIVTVFQYLESVRKKGFPIKEVHLTGGEPTLHPRFKEFVNLLLTNNYKVKITTNGNFNADIKEFLKQSNLTGINFSIHTINAKNLKNFQVGKTDKECHRIVENQLKNIKEINSSEKSIKINAVILDKRMTEEMLKFAIEEEIYLRFLPELNDYNRTYKIIKEIIQQQQFKKTSLNGNKRIYSGLITYYKNSDGYILGIKEIQKVYNQHLCELCKYKNTPKCREGFYAIRIFRNGSNGKHMVRLCLDRNDGNTVIPLEEFNISDF